MAEHEKTEGAYLKRVRERLDAVVHELYMSLEEIEGVARNTEDADVRSQCNAILHAHAYQSSPAIG